MCKWPQLIQVGTTWSIFSTIASEDFHFISKELNPRTWDRRGSLFEEVGSESKVGKFRINDRRLAEHSPPRNENSNYKKFHPNFSTQSNSAHSGVLYDMSVMAVNVSVIYYLISLFVRWKKLLHTDRALERCSEKYISYSDLKHERDGHSTPTGWASWKP